MSPPHSCEAFLDPWTERQHTCMLWPMSMEPWATTKKSLNYWGGDTGSCLGPYPTAACPKFLIGCRLGWELFRPPSYLPQKYQIIFEFMFYLYMCPQSIRKLLCCSSIRAILYFYSYFHNNHTPVLYLFTNNLPIWFK